MNYLNRFWIRTYYLHLNLIFCGISLAIGKPSSINSKDQVILYENGDFKGNQHPIKEVIRCHNLPPHIQDNVSSIRTKMCLILYTNTCCQGKAYQIHKDNDLSRSSMERNISSLSPCGSYWSEPPKTIHESWGGHNESMRKVAEFKDISLYQDANVVGSSSEDAFWQADFASQVWGYTKATYGSFGPEDSPLLVFLHGSNVESVIMPRKGLLKPKPSLKEVRGTHRTYFDSDAECRNLVDVKSFGVITEEMDDIIREISSIVESSFKGVRSHVTGALYDLEDSPFSEIFIFDVYTQLDLHEEAQRVFQNFMNSSRQMKFYVRDEPVYWFRDWFHPLYERYGGVRVFNKFFDLVQRYFPRGGGACNQDDSEGKKGKKEWCLGREMNFGEYIHFFSGATGFNLMELSEEGFDLHQDTDFDFMRAQREFPAIEYV